MNDFIKINPVFFRREVIVDFETMESKLIDVKLAPFAINRFPVTNEEFFSFIRMSGYSPENAKGFLFHWSETMTPEYGKELHPVVNVSYDDALAYARFKGARLPSDQEWLYAAFGPSNYNYPWGDDFSPCLCNVRESRKGGTTPVGSYSPQGDSVFGCADMIGNVWEWTSTSIDVDNELFLALGTGWDHYSHQREIPLNSWYRNHSVGFRMVKDT